MFTNLNIGLLISNYRFTVYDASRIASGIFKRFYSTGTVAWHRWLDVPRDVRDLLFERFMV